jgi:hypothetical protein
MFQIAVAEKIIFQVSTLEIGYKAMLSEIVAA